MQHIPDLSGPRRTATLRVVLSGGGETAVAPRSLASLAAEDRAHLTRSSPPAAAPIGRLGRGGHVCALGCARAFASRDGSAGAAYAAEDDAGPMPRTRASPAADWRAVQHRGTNLADSQFITPPIVGPRSVTVAIGTEGAGPRLARAIKRDLEEPCPRASASSPGSGKAFRGAADRAAHGPRAPRFWAGLLFPTRPPGPGRREDACALPGPPCSRPMPARRKAAGRGAFRRRPGASESC